MEYQFEKLKIWQMGMNIAERVYLLTKRYPEDEKFGMISQMRRAAYSVPTNIAEGKGRFHTKELIQFMYIARASLYELMTFVKLSERLKYLSEKESDELLKSCWETTGGINGFVDSLK